MTLADQGAGQAAAIIAYAILAGLHGTAEKC
jgi:hypothetical protein